MRASVGVARAMFPIETVGPDHSLCFYYIYICIFLGGGVTLVLHACLPHHGGGFVTDSSIGFGKKPPLAPAKRGSSVVL